MHACMTRIPVADWSSQGLTWPGNFWLTTAWLCQSGMLCSSKQQAGIPPQGQRCDEIPLMVCPAGGHHICC